MKAILILILLGATTASCSSTPPDETSPSADLQITFGAAPARRVSGEVTVDQTSTRNLVQVTDTDVVVFFSLPMPIVSPVVVGTSDDLGIVWAKDGASQPSTATSGTLEITATLEVSSVLVHDVVKPDDALGPSLRITGSMSNIRVR